MKENKKSKAWVPGETPYTKQHQAEAIKVLRERLEAVTEQKSTEANVNLNTVLWEICQIFKLSDIHQALALGEEGYAEIQRKLAEAMTNAVWH